LPDQPDRLIPASAEQPGDPQRDLAMSTGDYDPHEP
jgi:hypothetical protein